MPGSTLWDQAQPRSANVPELVSLPETLECQWLAWRDEQIMLYLVDKFK